MTSRYTSFILASERRRKEVCKYYLKHGAQAAAKHFRISRQRVYQLLGKEAR